jgi:hypothetical protein
MKKTVGRIVIICVLGVIAGYLGLRAIREKPAYEMPSAPAVVADKAGRDIVERRHQPKGPTKVKSRANEFSDSEKSDFKENFEKKYRPAILKWCDVYHGHIPIAAGDITADKLAERVGIGGDYNEYIFVVNGVTLGVCDSKAEVTVDYLNVRSETQKMNTLPNGSQVPNLTSPVNQRDILAMVQSDIGKEFNTKDVQTIPTGISGALNGGAMVEVGGDPNNFASWRLNMVFGADGRLAYYLKGPPAKD